MADKGKFAEVIMRAGCNLKCKQCFVGECKKQDYDIDKAFETVKEFSEKGFDVFAYPLELPFLYGTPDFEKIAKMYQITKQRMLTNGVLIGKKPEILDALLGYGINELSIGNFEGIDEKTQDIVTGQGETLEYTIKGIKNAVDRGFKKVGVYSVLNKANIGQAREMCAKVRELGADSILFLRLMPVGTAKELDELLLNPEDVEGFIKEVYTVIRPESKDFEVRMSFNFGPDMYSKRTLEFIDQKGFICGPANPEYIAVEPLKDGNRYYKCFFGMGEQELIKTDITEKFDVNKLKGMCGECDHKEKCGGGCRVLAYKQTGDFYGSIDVCRTKVIEKYGLHGINK